MTTDAPLATTKPALSSSRRWLFRLAVPLGLFFLIFVGGEIVLRASGVQVGLKQFNPPIYRQDADTAWSLKPSYSGAFESFLSEFKIHTTSLGFRGHEIAATAPAHRVLCLGDSNTFGYGTGDPDCYPAQLEARLREQDPSAEAVNTGVPGYDTIQERITYEKRGLALKATAVILQWNINDLEKSNLKTIVMDDDSLVDPDNLDKYEKIKSRKSAWWSHSVFLTWLNVNYRIWKHQHITQAERAQNFDDEEIARKSFDENFGEIVKIRDLARGQGARFLMLTSPLRIEVERGVTGKYRKKLSDFAAREKIDLIDPLDALRAAWSAKQETLFVERDSGHLNVKGNAIVADLAFKWYRAEPSK